MVDIDVGQYESQWYGVAWEGECYVATAAGFTRGKALQSLLNCLPEGVDTRSSDKPSAFFTGAVNMLGELEQGNEEHKMFTLSARYRSDSMQAILTAAAAVPIGYVTTYGDIAKTVGSEARAVGRAMATNPLYPIVPCHRVVGADMSLVGYGGKQTENALNAKLGRLIKEARGAMSELNLTLSFGVLTVYPVEQVITAAREHRERREQKAALEAEREAAERRQLRLF